MSATLSVLIPLCWGWWQPARLGAVSEQGGKRARCPEVQNVQSHLIPLWTSKSTPFLQSWCPEPLQFQFLLKEASQGRREQSPGHKGMGSYLGVTP